MRTSRINFYINGIILILLGALTLYHPEDALMSVGFFIGIGLIASALNLFSGFYYFRLKRFIVWGILDLISGILLFLQPGMTAFIIPFAVAFWLFSVGISRTCAALWLGGGKIRGWWFMLIDGMALIFVALLMCLSPIVSALSVMMVIGCGLIASGVLVIAEGCIMFAKE
ncbi:MAG: DUF308 domain-containing protein [Synergistaceae bacterium]|nr:DUF308 domain-containing protein [Synergistaceae bacterium]